MTKRPPKVFYTSMIPSSRMRRMEAMALDTRRLSCFPLFRGDARSDPNAGAPSHTHTHTSDLMIGLWTIRTRLKVSPRQMVLVHYGRRLHRVRLTLPLPSQLPCRRRLSRTFPLLLFPGQMKRRRSNITRRRMKVMEKSGWIASILLLPRTLESVRVEMDSGLIDDLRLELARSLTRGARHC